MKKLLTLATLALVCIGAAGCRCHPWWNRGAPCNACGANTAAIDPYMGAPNATYADGGVLPNPDN